MKTRKHNYLLVISVTATLILTIITIVGTDIIAANIDKMLTGEAVNITSMLPALMILILCGTVISYIKTITAQKFSINVTGDFRKACIDKLLKIRYGYYFSNTSGSIMTKLVSDIDIVGNYYSSILPDIITTITMIVVVLIYVFIKNKALALAVMICYPFVIFITRKIGNMLEALIRKHLSKWDALMDIANDSVAGIEVVKSYNLYRVMKKRFGDYIVEILSYNYRRIRIMHWGYLFNHVAFWIPSIICPMVALFMVLDGKMTIGAMTAYIVLVNRAVSYMIQLPELMNEKRQQNVSKERIVELINQQEEYCGTEIITKENIKNSKNAVEFENISFKYEDGNNVLNKISFQIETGKTTAIVGSSGQGKTTIFSLICGMYFANSGVYRLYGKDFNKLDLQEARSMISLVSQNVFIFSGTIEENVAFGRKDATHEEIVEACKKAQIHEFIQGLPDGYDTLTGENGSLLSGGQCQRISIARAFLKDSPLLLLDEPTSAVDGATESLITDSIKELSKNRTVIIIAHRLSTIENADRIIHMEKGGVVIEEK